MAFDIFDLAAKISLDSSELEEGLQKTQGSLSGGLKKAAAVGTAAVAAVGTAAIAAGTSLVKSTGDVAAYGDNIDKMSQKMGISAQAYQEWDAIMQHSGTSIDALKPSMKTLATQAEKGSDAFQKLGISEEEVASLSQEDLFAKVITGLQGMEEGTERTYITSQLLGRGATELGALLNTSAEETQEMRDRVHELGGVMSDDAVKASAQFQDTLQDMSTGFDSLKRNMLSEFLPAITGVMDGLTNLFTGDYDEGIERISEGVGQAIDKLSEMLPKILEVGKNILLALGNAIIQNLPVIIPALADLVMGIGQSIIDNLPMLADTGLQVILQLANGIGEALPDLIPSAVQAILTIAQGLVDNLPQLLSAAAALVGGLAQGLINSMPLIAAQVPGMVQQLVSYIQTNLPTMIKGITDFITQSLPQIVKCGLQIIQALGQGLIQAIPIIVEALPQLITAIITFIGEVLPEIIEAGVKLFVALIEELPEAIDKIVDALPEIIEAIVGALLDSLPEIIEAGVELFIALVENLPEIIAEIIAVTPEIISAIVEAFEDHSDDLKEAGKYLLEGLAKGLIAGIDGAVKAAKKAAGKIAKSVKDFFGISSPSKLFAQYGMYLDAGLAKGISGNLGMVDDAVDNMAESVSGSFDPSVDISTSRLSGGPIRTVGMDTSNLITPTATRPMTVILELDKVQFAKMVYQLNNSETQRVGVSLAGGVE